MKRKPKRRHNRAPRRLPETPSLRGMLAGLFGLGRANAKRTRVRVEVPMKPRPPGHAALVIKQLKFRVALLPRPSRPLTGQGKRVYWPKGAT